MQTNTQRGFSLVETLLYVAGTALLLGVVAFMLVNTYRWYSGAVVYPRADQDGDLITTRIGDDIRAGSSLNAALDTFNTAQGSISINAQDSSKTAVTYSYTLSNGRISYSKNGGTSEYISPANLYVSKLQFNQIDTLHSTAVHFIIQIDYQGKNGTTTNTYSSLAILRNSYK